MFQQVRFVGLCLVLVGLLLKPAEALGQDKPAYAKVNSVKIEPNPAATLAERSRCEYLDAELETPGIDELQASCLYERSRSEQTADARPPHGFEGLKSLQRGLLRRLVHSKADASAPVPALCFASGTPQEVIDAAYKALANRRGDGADLDLFQFNDGNRWSATAFSPGPLGQGDPTVLTWSYVPDGTFIPGGPEPAGNSNLTAWLNGLYGGFATWHPLFVQVFERWGESTGVTYIYEPNDDGAAFPSAGGVVGVRGDVRIAAHFIDGDFNILAYNYFPDTGDMVLDSADSFYNDTFSNSIRFRNVVAHEHGHGIGISHVCPVNQTKLMEPFLTTAFDGPQHDDILAASRGYGDRFEHNDTSGTATDLGAVASGGSVTIADVSVDDNSDENWYGVTLPADARITVTVTPVGSMYLSGAQNPDGSCSAGTPFNSLAQSDLGLEVLAPDGTTVRATADVNPAGSPETIANLNLIDGTATYFVRVFGSANAAQLYELDMNLKTDCALTIMYTDQVDTGGNASGIALSPDESKLYVAYWEDENDSRVQEFSLPDLTLLDTFTFGGYHTHGDVVVSADGTRFFTTNYYYSDTSQIDMANGDARTDLPTCDTWPAGITLTPDKTKVLVSAGMDGRSYDMGNDCISVYDIADGAFSTLASVPLQDEPRGHSFGVSQDSRFAYIATRERQSSNPKLYEVSLEAPFEVTRTLDFPEASYELVYTRSLGNHVYVSDFENSKIWVVDRSTWTKTGYALESAPAASEVHPSGAYLFVLMPEIGSVVAIDVASMSIVARYDGLSSGANDIEFNNDGTKMYVAHVSPVGEIMVFDLGCAGPPCDDFEDGVIDDTLWEWGGREAICHSGGNWQFSHEEIVDADGYLKMRVWGPTSGITYCGEAWVHTEYDYNNGSNHIINFTWAADVNAWHVDNFAIQITDGTIPEGSSLGWFGIDGPTWKNLYYQSEQPDTLPMDWSIHIGAATQAATLFDGPNLTGQIIGQKTLPAGQSWHVRFIQQDGTSAGFPAGDNRLNVYDFCSTPGGPDCLPGTVRGWEPRASMPNPRNQIACAVVDNQIYVFGDAECSAINNRLETYDPQTDMWTKLADIPTPRGQAGAAAVDGIIYVIGGNNSCSNSWRTENEAYNPATDTWETKAPMPTTDRGRVTATAVNGLIYVMGGADSYDHLSAYNLAEVYDPSTDSWLPMSDPLHPNPMPRRRAHHAAVAIGSKIYLIGGWSDDGGQHLVPETDVFDTATGLWTQVAPLPTPRLLLDAVTIAGKIYAIGGAPQCCGAPWASIVEQYDPQLDSWTTVTALPSPRGDHCAGVVGGTIHVIGGMDDIGLLATTVASVSCPSGECGDGVVDPGEVCDDGNNVDCDGCRGDCSAVETGCGDGFVCGAEACDDGNNDACDGCDPVCVIEFCGDGVFCESLGEECDDGNTDNCDGCDSECVVEECGNDKTQCNEECDGTDDLVCLEPCQADCMCGPDGFDFEYRCVIHETPSAVDQTTELPAGLTAVGVGDTFYVEFWATDSRTTNTGVVSAYTDIDYPEGLVTCYDPEPSPLFNLFPGGVCDGLTVDEIGGSQLDPDIGVEPEWARIAYGEFTADVIGQADFVLQPAAEESSAHGRGLIPPIDIEYGTCTVEIACPCIYDLDDNCNIAGGDLGLFAPCWSVCDTEPGWDEFSCGDKDFDCNGCVSGGDLAWFAVGWGNTCSEIDSIVDYPPCRECDGPVYCPGGAAARGSDAGGVASSKSATRVLVSDASVLLSLQLSRLRGQVHTSSRIDRTGQGSVRAGEHVFAEVWAKDMSPTTDGLTVVFTDVHYIASQFKVVSIDPGETFTLFSDPTVRAENGVVLRVGGATMEPDHGANAWTRVAIVELEALADVARPVVTLRPSQGEAVSRYGQGLVPTDQVRVVPNRFKKPKSRTDGLRDRVTGD